jgi:hypothetical protein
METTWQQLLPQQQHQNPVVTLPGNSNRSAAASKLLHLPTHVKTKRRKNAQHIYPLGNASTCTLQIQLPMVGKLSMV